MAGRGGGHEPARKDSSRFQMEFSYIELEYKCLESWEEREDI